MNLIRLSIWQLKAPTRTQLDRYSVLPLAMIEREPAYMKRSSLVNALKHAEDGGVRQSQMWDFVYVQIPGYNRSVMRPNVERWESFGEGWANFVRLDNRSWSPAEYKAFVGDTDDWVTIVSFLGNFEVVTMSLTDWTNAKNMNAWRNAVQAKKQLAQRGAILPL